MLIKTFLAVVIVDTLVIFVIVWLWGMWVAFTQGDDVVAKFGRWVIDNAQQSVQRIFGSLRGLWAWFWLQVFSHLKPPPSPPKIR